MVRIVLLRLLESYFRHRWLYLLPLVIAVGAGAAFVATAPPKYVATGRLYVEKDSLLASLTSTSNSGAWWLTASQVTTSELNELIASRAFTRSVIEKTDLEQNMSAGQDAIDQTFSYYREAISYQTRGDKLVEISAASDNPSLAQQMVVATMDAYVQWKLNSDYQESITAQSFFQDLLPGYQQAVDNARADLIAYYNAHPEPVRGDRPPQEQLEVGRLQAALQRAEDRFSSAQNNAESAQLSQAQSESVTRQTYLVIDQPLLPTEPETSLKGIIQDLMIFVAVGLFLTLAGIGAGALFDRSLRFPLDVRHVLSLPVLAMIPTGKPEPATVAVSELAKPELAEQTASENANANDSSMLQPQV